MNVLLRGFFHMSLSYAWCFYQYTCTIMSIVAGLQLTNSYLRKASLTPAVFSRLTFGYMGIGTRGGAQGAIHAGGTQSPVHIPFPLIDCRNWL